MPKKQKRWNAAHPFPGPQPAQPQQTEVDTFPLRDDDEDDGYTGKATVWYFEDPNRCSLAIVEWNDGEVFAQINTPPEDVED